MTTTHPRGRRLIRELKHVRADARLPLTFLGTYGDHVPLPEQGWQSRMWSHHAFATGAVFAAGIAVNAAVEAGVLPSPGWTSAGAVLLGLVASAGGLLATAGEKFSDWARTYFTLTPAAAGIYLAAVAHVSPWSTGSLVSAAAGTAIGMGMYYQTRTQQDAHELAYVRRFASPPAPTAKRPAPAAAPMAPVYEQIDPEARKWNEALEAVGLKGCRFMRRKDTAAGYAVLIRLDRPGRIAPEKVGAALPAIERNLGMLRDCLEWDVATNSEGRELSDRCWIIVDVEDILAKLLPMPDDEHTPTTVKEAFRIGTFMDGTPMVLRLREISALIVGVRGRGKTNLFHVIVHMLSRCTDVVLWAIDLKGGRAVKPWLRPWLDGRAERPVFDWVATTRLEAFLMLKAAEALIKYRGNAGAGGSKIEPSAAHPAVLVLCDEIAALVGKHSGRAVKANGQKWWLDPTVGQIAGVLTLCIQLGRSEAVDFVLFTQRGTVTMTGGGDLKSQCELRIGLGVTSPSDANSVFQNNNVNAKKLRKLKDQRTRGAALVENGIDPNHLAGKIYFYGDDQDMLRRIDKAATLHALYPADLPTLEQRAIDEALLALTDDEYGYGVDDQATDERWCLDRAAHLYTDGLPDDWEDNPDDDDVLGTAPTSGGPTGGTATRTRPTPTRTQATAADPETEPEPEPPAATANRYYTRRADRNPTGQPAPASDDADARAYQKEFDELVAFLDTAPDATEPEYDSTDPDQQTRYNTMLEIIRDAGVGGITAGNIITAMIKRGRGWSKRQQIYPALKRAMKSDIVVQPLERGPYYWHSHAPKRVQ